MEGSQASSSGQCKIVLTLCSFFFFLANFKVIEIDHPFPCSRDSTEVIFSMNRLPFSFVRLHNCCHSCKEFGAEFHSMIKAFPNLFFLKLKAVSSLFSLSSWFSRETVLTFFLYYLFLENAHFPPLQFSRGIWTQLCGDSCVM